MATVESTLGSRGSEGPRRRTVQGAAVSLVADIAPRQERVRRMVECHAAFQLLASSLRESLEDELPSFRRLAKHKRSGETQDAEASFAELAVAPRIRSALGRLGVIRTVDFDDELGRRSVEVDDARAEQHHLLGAELISYGFAKLAS